MNYRYQNIQVIKYSATGSQYYVNNIYPQIAPTNEDSYVITVLGDRLDLLAYKYYNDVSMWWIIATANNLNDANFFVQPGIQLRIPSDLASISNNLAKINK